MANALPLTRRWQRPLQHRADDAFFVTAAILVLLAVFVGFARTYYLAGIFHARLPSPIVHIHGALFSCWILLFVTQIVFVSSGHIRWHMRLGIAGMILAALMVVVGFATLVEVIRRHAVFRIGIDTIFAGDTLMLSTFALLVYWGYLARKDAAAHKRLMVLATVALLGPALSRWPFAFAHSLVAFLCLLDVIPTLLIGFDLLSLRKVHRVTIFGVILILVMQFSILPLGHAAFWHRFTLLVQGP